MNKHFQKNLANDIPFFGKKTSKIQFRSRIELMFTTHSRFMLIHGINDCQDLQKTSNVKINMDEQCSSLLHFGFCGMAHVFFLPQTHYGPGALHTEKSPIFNYEMCSLNTSGPMESTDQA